MLPPTAQESTSKQVAGYVACLFEPDDIVEIRRLPSRRSTWHRAAELPEQAEALQADNKHDHIFVGANPRKVAGGTTDADVEIARSLFADFDDTSADDAKDSWQTAGLPEPTLVVNSGHGVHVYWRLTEPIDPKTFTRWQADVASVLKSDRVVKNPSRIMRLPGFMNHKPPLAQCSIVGADPARVCDLADFHERIPVAAKERTQTTAPAASTGQTNGRAGLDAVARAAAYLNKVPGAVEGENGDDHTFRTACKLVNDFGLSIEQAVPLLREWNSQCEPSWSDDELRRKLENAARYAKQPHGNKTATTTAKPTDPPPPAWLSVREVMHASKYSRGLPAIGSGLGSLDELMSGGFRSGCVTIIAGRTGSAKSQLATNIVRLAALSGTSTLFFALEDAPTVVTWRMHAASANTPMEVLLGGIQGVGPGIDALRETYRLLADLPLRLTDLRDVRRIVDLIEKHASEGGELVVLDQLSKITAPYLPPSANAYQKTSEISEQLRLVAIQTGLPLVIIVQVNREASKRCGELELYDLRDSGMLEQDAATVLLINSATDPPTTTGQPRAFAKLLPVKLAKSRFGPAGGSVELLWHPRTARIDDLALRDRT